MNVAYAADVAYAWPLTGGGACIRQTHASGHVRLMVATSIPDDRPRSRTEQEREAC